MKEVNWIRLVFFLLSSWVMFQFSSFSTEFLIEMLPDNPANSVTIDGADFTPFFNLFQFAFSGFLVFAGTLILVVACLFAFLIYRFIAIRKQSVIADREYELTKKIFWYVVSVSFLMQTTYFRLKFWYITLISHGIVTLFAFIYITTARQHTESHWKLMQESEETEKNS